MYEQTQTAPELDLENSPAPQTPKIEVAPLSESQLESVLAVKNLSFAWPSSSATSPTCVQTLKSI